MNCPVPVYDTGTKVQIYHGRNAAVYPAVIVQCRYNFTGMWFYKVKW